MKFFFLFAFTFSTISLAQGPGIATNPTPLDSSENIQWFFQPITWTNPPNATENKVFVGIHPEYLTELHSGSLIDSFVLPSPLEIRKTYYWRVDEIDSTGITEGDVWFFTTKNTLIPVFIDSFASGLNNWTATNENDSCGWKIENLESSYYDLPPTAETYGVRTDNNLCGNNRIISVLELTNPPDLTNYTRFGIGWDNDLMLSGASDSVYLEVSSDGGISWNRVWERIGRNQRKSQEEISFLDFNFNPNVQVRFRSSLESTSSWWAIDNFYIWATDLAFFQLFPPSNLTYDLNVGDSLNVLLNWQPGGGIPSLDRYRIQRKLGDSLDQYAYFTLGETNLNNFSFLDNSVVEKTEYSYRVGICEGPIQGINGYPITLITESVPVELISFSATVNGNSVTLNWLTATETNNYGFEMLRRTSTNINEWEIIGFVGGNGTTTEKQSYSFTDELLLSGKYHYRLKQIDFDGSYEFSQILEVNIEVPAKFSLEQNFPNPFNPTTTINYSIKYNGSVQLRVFDILGRKVTELVNKTQQAGDYSVTFNASKQPSGIYFYVLKSGNFSETKKLLLLK
jgi:Secretion system C-terminal sorting domain